MTSGWTTKWALVLFYVILPAVSSGRADKPPHIVFIAADDLGWNDVGFHGNEAIFTPNLDRLAHEGVILNRSYVQPLCSPTRSAFMGGRFPFHTGLQHAVIKPELGYGLNLSITTTAQHLKALGYATHIVGKWHLGYCKEAYTPTQRGFDTFFGYYLGEEDYYTHRRAWSIPGDSEDISVSGLDFHRDTTTSYSNVLTDNQTYSTYVFAREVLNIINTHDVSKPLYLYMPFQAVHAPLQAPQRFINKYAHIQNEKRRTFSAMVSAMDEAIGNITQALQDKGLWESTLLVFTTDNGGPVGSGANNWPLRGSKATVWEGGTRGSAFVHGTMLNKTGYTYNGLMHAVDWYPTIVAAAGGSVHDPEMDGMNLWPNLVNGVDSPRTSLVYNIDTSANIAAIRSGPWKFINGTPGQASWYPPANASISADNYLMQFEDSAVNKTTKWLFNLDDDPLEKNNLYEAQPQQAAMMEKQLDEYMKSYVPDLYHQHPPDPKCNPANFHDAWSPGWC